jgi:hypothetical protein
MNSAYAVVDPQYFETIGIEIVAGRAFTAADGPGAPSAAIVNEVLAETLWPGENPVGRTFTGVGTTVVVGVARDAKVLSVGEPPSPFVFRPVAQDYASLMTIHMRSDLPEGAALEEMRRVVRDMDPRIALQGEESMAEIVGETLFPQRFGAGLLSIFAAAGLFFAAIGIYGMLHFLVAQRRREAGIRLALGARPLQLSWELTRKGFGLTTVALVLGLLVSLPVAALLRSVMIGVSPFDPATFLVVAVLTMAVAIVASSFPARSATRADPLEALRSD